MAERRVRDTVVSDVTIRSLVLHHHSRGTTWRTEKSGRLRIDAIGQGLNYRFEIHGVAVFEPGTRVYSCDELDEFRDQVEEKAVRVTWFDEPVSETVE